MKMTKRKVKIWAKMLSVILIISMAGGYTKPPVVVKADLYLQKQNETVTESENTSEGETTADISEEETTIDPDEYTLVAHRGYSGYAPANSMPALEKAIAAGFTTIELDVRRCIPEANGEINWVISHDDSLKNTMGVDKNISELMYSQILQYSYTKGNGVENFKNLKIVNYRQVIDLMKACQDEGINIVWQIEIKETTDVNYMDYFEEELVKPIVEAGVQDNVVFSSFEETYLKKIKLIDENLKVWYLNTNLTDSVITRAKACGAVGVSFKGTVDTTKEENIKKALDEGLRVGCYAIDSQVIMGVYYQWGVRNFATNMLSPMDVHKDMLTGKYNVRAFTATVAKDTITYDGTRKLPKVKVTYKDVELVEGLNYSLSYTDNKNPGTAAVYISGLNNCISEQKLTYNIVMPKVTGFKITSEKTTYIKMSWNRVKDVTGYIIYRYNNSLKKYEAIKTLPMTSADTVTLKVKKLTSATKYKFRVKTYVGSEGKIYESEPCSAKTAYTRPAKTKINRLKRYKGHKRLRINWALVPRCTGYNVQIATDRKMKNVVGTYTLKGSKSTKLKLKKLLPKKTYYVRVRAYLKGGSKIYNGVYTTAKKSAKKPKK